MLKGVVLKNYYYLGIALCVLSSLAIVLLRGYLPPVVPLLYGLPLGEGQLVPTLGLLIAPGVSLLIIIINIFLSRLIKDDFSKRALATTSLIVSIVATISVVKIVFLVGFF